MKLCAKVVVAMRHQPVASRASALVMSAHFNAMLLKFVTSEDR
jgi:hypothetical protein